MRKIIPFLIGAAVVAPLYLATPAEAQSSRDIQRLEERVQDARNRGDWSYASQLERELNQQRLQYQRNHGIGEYQGYNRGYYNGYYSRPYYNDGYYTNNGYYPGNGYTNNGFYSNSSNSAARTIIPFALDILRGAVNNQNSYSRGYYDGNGNWRSY